MMRRYEALLSELESRLEEQYATLKRRLAERTDSIADRLPESELRLSISRSYDLAAALVEPYESLEVGRLRRKLRSWMQWLGEKGKFENNILPFAIVNTPSY